MRGWKMAIRHMYGTCLAALLLAGAGRPVEAGCTKDSLFFHDVFAAERQRPSKAGGL
jgi:hypothetical protein